MIQARGGNEDGSVMAELVEVENQMNSSFLEELQRLDSGGWKATQGRVAVVQPGDNQPPD